MLLDLIRTNLEVVLVGSLALQLVLLILVLAGWLKNKRITKKFQILMENTSQDNLEQLLMQALEVTERNNSALKKVEERQIEIRTTLMKTLQNRAVVRFNAFEDLGGELSFSIALLDANGDGVVVSSLYGRQDCRTYAKPITEGLSKYPLSEEEIQAVKEALQARSTR